MATTKTKQVSTPTSKAVIRWGYDSYVLPVEDAMAIAQAMSRAEKIEHDGYGDKRMYFIGNMPEDTINLNLELLPESAYLQGKFAGCKATYSHDNNDINV
jgi:hypothetical protein